MKRLFISFLLTAAIALPISRYQSIAKTWSQPQIQKLVDTTVVAFVTDGSAEWLGTGVIIDKRGTILTAAHVIAGKEPPTITVLVSKGNVYRCVRLAIDYQRDLGVVRVLNSAQKFPYAKLQRSDNYWVGQDVLVIGHPHGLFWTVTQGIISRVWYMIPAASWRFDTTALVNPGNSGGPAFNEKGEVIGIISAMHVGFTGLKIGLGIVVPITEIHKFLKNNANKINRPWPKPRLRLGDVKSAV